MGSGSYGGGLGVNGKDIFIFPTEMARELVLG